MFPKRLDRRDLVTSRPVVISYRPLQIKLDIVETKSELNLELDFSVFKASSSDFDHNPISILDEKSLCDFLNLNGLKFQLRRSAGFSSLGNGVPVCIYPPAETMPQLYCQLRLIERNYGGRRLVAISLRAAMLAIYHPLVDGNGRLFRTIVATAICRSSEEVFYIKSLLKLNRELVVALFYELACSALFEDFLLEFMRLLRFVITKTRNLDLTRSPLEATG